jgi:hypothetical protein
LTSFLNLKFLDLQIFNSEGRNLEFEVQKSELAHTQDVVVLAYSIIGRKNGIFAYFAPKITWFYDKSIKVMPRQPSPF